MRILKPIDVTPLKLLASNIPEPDPDYDMIKGHLASAWDSVTAYSADDVVLHAHRLWQAVASNTDSEPGDASVQPPVWVDCGASNRWRMFDNRIGTRSRRVDGIDATVRPSEVVSAVAVMEIFALAVRVTVIDPVEGEVYRRTQATADLGVSDWWEYFFTLPEREDWALFDDLPAYGTADLRVELLVDDDQVAECGHISIGRITDLGCTQFGASVGIQSFSRKVRDEFGNFFILPRSYSKRGDFDVSVRTNRVSYTQRFLADLRDTPVLYIGSNLHEATAIFGFFREFLLVINAPTVSQCNISIEGLV